jgi:hypothetical protein
VIHNDREYEAAEKRFAELQTRLEETAGISREEEGPVLEGTVAGIRRLAEDVASELEEYKRLKGGEVTLFGARDLDSFGESIVKARLASGMDESELAEAVGVDREDIERHERYGYQKAPLWLIAEIADALEAQADLRLRIPEREQPVPWSVIDELSEGRPVALGGQGTLTLQPDQEEDDDAPPPGPGRVNFGICYSPMEDGNRKILLSLYSTDDGGAEILSWVPKNTEERTSPRYDLSGTIDAPDGTVPVEISPVFVDFTASPAGHGLMQDEALEVRAGPGLGSDFVKVRALVPNLSVSAEGEAAGLRFRRYPAHGGVQTDGVFPDQVGKILPGSFLELEKTGDDADLGFAVEAFGWFLSFYAGRSVHPIAWEAQTADGPVWAVQAGRKPSPLPQSFARTCLPLDCADSFLEQAWANWVGFDEERRARLQGVVTSYEAILATTYPVVRVALTAMYLERFREHVVGSSELLPLGPDFTKNKRRNVANELRAALKRAIADSGRLEEDQKEVLTRSLDDNPGKVLDLFRKSFRDSLLELHTKADLPVDEGELKRYIDERDAVLHGSWKANREGTLKTYWLARYGLAILEKLILRRFGYEGRYYDREKQAIEILPRGAPSW